MTKRPRRGKLIVFEGPDGVGKTTLAGLLAARLNRAGVLTDHLSFPGKQPGSLGHLVYGLHHDPSAMGVDHIDPTSAQILHIAAHIDSIEEQILPALKAGRWVVLDRFWWSIRVYGAAYRVPEPSLRAMIRLERLHWKTIKPSVVFLVKREPSMAETSDEERNAVITGYSQLAEQEQNRSPVRVIENKSTVEVALDLVWNEIETLLPLPQSRGQTTSTWQGDRQPSLLTEGPPRQYRLSDHSPAQTTVVYDTYWRFAVERQEMFFRRVEGMMPPLSEDSILKRHKFTNTYRASDRVSQYLIRHVIYEGDQSPQEVFFRTILSVKGGEIMYHLGGRALWCGV